MKILLVAAAAAFALSASPNHSATAKHNVQPLLTEAAEGGSINNNYGTPQPRPEYAAFVQPTAAVTAPVSL